MSEIANFLAQANTIIKDRAAYLQKLETSRKLQEMIERFYCLANQQKLKLEASKKEDQLLTKYFEQLQNYSNSFNEFMEGKCRNSRRRSIGKVVKKSEILVPDLSNCNEFIRQLSQDRIVDRLAANWAKTIEQLKKLKQTALRIETRFKELPQPLELSMFSKNQQNDSQPYEPRN